MSKLRIGIFSYTCDEGCSIQILEILNNKYRYWQNLMDIINFRLIKTQRELKKIDVAFVEGAISTDEDLEELKKIRKNSKKLVAIGSCAILGSPANQRNLFDEKTKKKIRPFLKRFKHRENVQPIGDFVKVDAEVQGCPISESGFSELMEKYFLEFGVKNA